MQCAERARLGSLRELIEVRYAKTLALLSASAVGGIVADFLESRKAAHEAKIDLDLVDAQIVQHQNDHHTKTGVIVAGRRTYVARPVAPAFGRKRSGGLSTERAVTDGECESFSFDQTPRTSLPPVTGRCCDNLGAAHFPTVWPFSLGNATALLNQKNGENFEVKNDLAP
jgi:hypothetical protein